MDVRFINGRWGKRLVEIDNAHMRFMNFRGEATQYNAKGARNFCIDILDEDIADAFENDKNEYGVGWKVKKKETEDGVLRMHLKVIVNMESKFPPEIKLHTPDGSIVHIDKMPEKTREKMFQKIDRNIQIDHVDLDISPNDGQNLNGPFRTAYLNGIDIYQGYTGRYGYGSDYAEEEYPEE